MSVEQTPRPMQEHEASARAKGRIERMHGVIRRQVGLGSRVGRVATLSEINKRLDSVVRGINRRPS